MPERRHKRLPLGDRPKCPDCREWLVAHRALKSGAGKYFSCSNEGCGLYHRYQAYRQTPSGRWEPFTPTRGPRVRTPATPCPACSGKNTLRRIGHLGANGQRKMPVARVRCNKCGARFEFNEETGLLTPTRPSGFQRGLSPPECPKKHGPMRMTGNTRRAGVTVYRYTCTQAPRCKAVVYRDTKGNLHEPPDQRVTEFRGFICDMPGCNNPRADQVDGRRRWCAEHERLTPVQRHRLVRKNEAWLEALAEDRFASKRLVGVEKNPRRPGLHTEFALWLSGQLARRGLTTHGAALKAQLPPNTVRNWSIGLSLPDRVEDFEPLRPLLGYGLEDFLRHWRRRTRASGTEAGSISVVAG